ncbi:temperature dependent protein affecting M2 dsRNA replication [Cercophora scortea]|uniref:Temperature dependent protein affecting M2 dsRNA replication n=1 Tax=Cercophora scortea TaxID=314031 RepID=A0AAE0IMN6_9PEZI|nr:temperature dependent protein affecting M2 dsRNA replication [Cercophora scortea]
MSAFEPTVSKYSSVPNLYEALVVAFELLRFELLNARNKHEELRGLPMSGSEEDQTCLLLISRCATLLKLRHEPVGYTGPLNKNLLAFRSLGAEVRSADRDLVDSIVASMFLYAQAKRKRDDLWQLGHELPFTTDPDIALAIAVKTYIDDVIPTDSLEMKEAKKAHFPTVFVPYAVAFVEDLDIACKFFEAIYAGIKTLDTKEISAGDRATWDKAARYLEVRR